MGWVRWEHKKVKIVITGMSWLELWSASETERVGDEGNQNKDDAVELPNSENGEDGGASLCRFRRNIRTSEGRCSMTISPHNFAPYSTSLTI